MVITLNDGARSWEERPEYSICALPLEGLLPCLSPTLLGAAPALGLLEQLDVDWMNGIQLFFREPGPVYSLLRPRGVPYGHTNHIDSPWALTSIWQDRFWKLPQQAYGNGEVKALLSVDISDWERPGIVYGKPARELDGSQQILDEVLAQLRRSLGNPRYLRQENLLAWFLELSIRPGLGPRKIPAPRGAEGYPVCNLEPLLINTVNSWHKRPETDVGLSNMVLAGDYVRTTTDLATMEAANESGRRAVRHILAREGKEVDVPLFPLEEPAVFDRLKRRDAERFLRGLPQAVWGA